jgi:hypothetical protein
MTAWRDTGDIQPCRSRFPVDHLLLYRWPKSPLCQSLFPGLYRGIMKTEKILWESGTALPAPEGALPGAGSMSQEDPAIAGPRRTGRGAGPRAHRPLPGDLRHESPPAGLKESPRRHGMTLRDVGQSSRRAGVASRRCGQTPRRAGITIRRPGMTTRRSGNSARYAGETPRNGEESPRRPAWSARSQENPARDAAESGQACPEGRRSGDQRDDKDLKDGRRRVLSLRSFSSPWSAPVIRPRRRWRGLQRDARSTVPASST